MKSPYQRSTVEAKVKKSLALVFGIEPDEIQSSSNLAHDLGADSLDYVELRALLEKQLGILLPTHSVLEHGARLTGQEDRFMQAGRLTEDGARLLWNSPFEFTPEQVHEGTRVADLFDTMNTSNWVALCFHLTQSLPKRCPDCGHTEATLSPQGRIVCAHCAKVLPLPTGDESMSCQLASVLESQPA